MTRRLLLAALCLAVIVGPAREAAAQFEPQPEANRVQQAVYAELGGSGILYTLNYEIAPSPYVALRAGAAVIPFFESTAPLVTLAALSPFFEGEHHLEIGAGVTVAIVDDDDARFLVPSIGYRYRQEERGFVFRATFTPLFRLNDPSDILYWGGLSAGYGW